MGNKTIWPCEERHMLLKCQVYRDYAPNIGVHPKFPLVVASGWLPKPLRPGYSTIRSQVRQVRIINIVI